MGKNKKAKKKKKKSFKKSFEKFINSGEFSVQSRKYFIKDLTWTMPKVMAHCNVLLKADHPIVVVDYHSQYCLVYS